jgi:Domain of unknown function (DUF6484)
MAADGTIAELGRIDGVVIGRLVGFDGPVPLVAFAGSPGPGVSARSLAALDGTALGAEVALLFDGGDPLRPLIVGPVFEPARDPAPAVVRDGERVRVTAAERIELRVGKASLIMEKDGRITIRGSYVTSHASATNRIRGGSVNLN